MADDAQFCTPPPPDRPRRQHLCPAALGGVRGATGYNLYRQVAGRPRSRKPINGSMPITPPDSGRSCGLSSAKARPSGRRSPTASARSAATAADR